MLIQNDLEPNPSDDEKYRLVQERSLRQWENLCACCGSCCGIPENDPCEHLVEAGKGKYHCGVYDTRFGEHKTKSGRIFKCVPIRDILHLSWQGDRNCRYKRKLSHL